MRSIKNGSSPGADQRLEPESWHSGATEILAAGTRGPGDLDHYRSSVTSASPPGGGGRPKTAPPSGRPGLQELANFGTRTLVYRPDRDAPLIARHRYKDPWWKPCHVRPDPGRRGGHLLRDLCLRRGRQDSRLPH